MARGADGVFPGQAQRKYDFRRGQSLGKNDHVVQWTKPQKPAWMTQEDYDNSPETVTVREFKVNGKVYVTTLLSAKTYHKKELAKLYKLRWQVEINLGSIKTTLSMEHLVCKTPGMVRKELAAHLLAYNVIRIIIAQACYRYGGTPNNISFKATVQLLNQFMPRLMPGLSQQDPAEVYVSFLKMILKNKVGNRPGRYEPRLIKRRKSSFPLMQNSRKIEKEKIEKKQKKNRKSAEAKC